MYNKICIPGMSALGIILQEDLMSRQTFTLHTLTEKVAAHVQAETTVLSQESDTSSDVGMISEVVNNAW